MGEIFSKILKWVYTKVKNFVSPILGLYYDDKKTVYQQPNTPSGESFVTSSQIDSIKYDRSKNEPKKQRISTAIDKSNVYC